MASSSVDCEYETIRMACASCREFNTFTVPLYPEDELYLECGKCANRVVPPRVKKETDSLSAHMETYVCQDQTANNFASRSQLTHEFAGESSGHGCSIDPQGQQKPMGIDLHQDMLHQRQYLQGYPQEIAFNQYVNPYAQYTNLYAAQYVNQFANKSTNKSANKPTNKSANKSTNKSTNKSANKSATKSEARINGLNDLDHLHTSQASPLSPPLKTASQKRIQTKRQCAESTDLSIENTYSKKCHHLKLQRFSKQQLALLKLHYQTGDRWPAWETRETFGKMFGVSQRKVQIWFQNTRQKLGHANPQKQGNVGSPAKKIRRRGKKRFGCDMCNKKFVFEHGLLRHTKSTACANGKCLTCGKTFANHSNRKRHEMSHICDKDYEPSSREKVLASAGGSSKQKRIACDICGQVFRHNTKLKVHMRRHTGVDKFACEHCGKKFISLKIHLRTHTRT